ncbi:MAG: biotin/lipoate A/B protein ligase family protein [Candidatus Bipolaricaulia bacterium]
MQTPWRLLTTDVPTDPALNYALDQAIAEHVGSAEAAPTVRLWRPGECLALGRFDTKLPRFDDAVAHLKSQGYRVLHRLSGGKAVWQDDGYLNFSVMAPRGQMGVPEAYRTFSEGFMAGLAELGLESAFKHVEGAFCDGPYDLAIGARKLVGTAQVQKRSYMIVHGTAMIDCEIADMVRIVGEFYARAGDPMDLRAATMITLREALQRPIEVDEVIDGLAAGYAGSLGALERDEATEAELSRARQLSETVQL